MGESFVICLIFLLLYLPAQAYAQFKDMLRTLFVYSIPLTKEVAYQKEDGFHNVIPSFCARCNCLGNPPEIPSFELVDQKLEISVDFVLEGIGQWKHTLSVFISTPEQLIESREKARQINHRLF